MRRKRRFALRTIRNGAVTIYGRVYKPERDATRFDGMRAAFGLYYGPPCLQGYDEDGLQTGFVSLWGSEKAYKSDDPEVDWPGPFCEDGVFKWEWWQRQPGTEESMRCEDAT